MRIGILGSAGVAQSLAKGFLSRGDQVMLGTRDTGKLAEWSEENPGAHLGDVPAAAAYGDILVVAMKGKYSEEVLRSLDPAVLEGKLMIDATNPIDDESIDNGVLRFFTGPNDSLMERFQKQFPNARFVKAFNSVGAPHMIDPKFDATPTMFICGNDADSKRTVNEILKGFGWEVADMGGVEAARAIEPLCVLWCIPGIRDGHWNHAFKLLTNDQPSAVG